MSKPQARHTPVEVEAARLLAVKDGLGQAWSAEHDARLQAWLAQDVAHRVAWLRLHEAWRRAGTLAEATVPRPSLRGRPLLTGSWWRLGWPPRAATAIVIAAVMLTAVPLVLLVPPDLGNRSTQHAGSTRSPVVTEVGVRRALTLTDGSKITLNTHTQVRTEIAAIARRVWLDDGEAFFEVSHDPSRPFVVLAGSDRVTVLGTRFSVRRSGNTTQVLVQEGRVHVEHAVGQGRSQAPLLLTAGAEVALQDDSILLQQHTAQQVLQALDWRRGRLTFHDRALADVAAEFNRYHHRQLVVDAAAGAMRISGTFEIDNLDGFARLMHDGLGLQISSQDDDLHLNQP